MPVVLAQHDGRLRDARQVGELRLDLAELDAEAADLDLVVDAAVEDDVAVVVEADGVAGAVEDRVAAVGREGIGDELLGRQLGALEIALRRRRGRRSAARPARPAPSRSSVLVDDVAGVVRDRPADGHRLARRAPRQAVATTVASVGP